MYKVKKINRVVKTFCLVFALFMCPCHQTKTVHIRTLPVPITVQYQPAKIL